MKFNSKLPLFWLVFGIVVVTITKIFGQVPDNTISSGFNWGVALGILGAAISTFLGGCGSAWGLGVSGQSAMGALTEDPNKFGVVFPIMALPGTQGIYGLLIGFLILTKVGVLGGNIADMSIQKGLYASIIGLPVGIACLISGYWQGAAAAAAIQLVSRKPSEFGKAIIAPALVETYAVFGLLISFLMWLKL